MHAARSGSLLWAAAAALTEMRASSRDTNPMEKSSVCMGAGVKGYSRACEQGALLGGVWATRHQAHAPHLAASWWGTGGAAPIHNAAGRSPPLYLSSLRVPQTYLELICVDSATAYTMPAYNYGRLRGRLLLTARRLLSGGAGEASATAAQAVEAANAVLAAAGGDGMTAGVAHTQYVEHVHGSTCGPGQVQLYPEEALHGSHVLIALIAIVHIAYACASTGLCLGRLRMWKKFEVHAQLVRGCGGLCGCGCGAVRLVGGCGGLWGPRLCVPRTAGERVQARAHERRSSS